MSERANLIYAEKNPDGFPGKCLASIPVFNIVAWENASKYPINPSLANRTVILASRAKDDQGIPKRLILLGLREFEILQHICASPVANKTLAEILNTSVVTVNHQIRNIFGKFDLNWENKVLLILELIRSGMLEYRPIIDDSGTPKFKRDTPIFRRKAIPNLS